MEVELLVKLGGIGDEDGLVEVEGLMNVKLPQTVGGLLKLGWLPKEKELGGGRVDC